MNLQDPEQSGSLLFPVWLIKREENADIQTYVMGRPKDQGPSQGDQTFAYYRIPVYQHLKLSDDIAIIFSEKPNKVWAGRKTRVHLSRGSSSHFLFIGGIVYEKRT